MTQKRQILVPVIATMLLSTTLISCMNNREYEPDAIKQETTVAFSLTGNPGRFDAVYLDIRQVEIVMEGQSAILVAPFRPGVYDLKKFSNGRDTSLLSSVQLPGKISQVRLVLGANNAVKKDGTVYPLNMPTTEQSIVVLNVKESFAANTSNRVWLNFDAEKSIVSTTSGYELKPRLRAYTKATDGRIGGYVLPAASSPVVYFTHGTETYSATPDESGYYLVTGLPGGNYSLNFAAGNNVYRDSTINNVQVGYSNAVTIGNVDLKQ